MSTKRSAGILLPITSLPSEYGIGDLGPEAAKFGKFLHDAGQKIWQVLPMTATDPGCGNSPYSPT
ncbi:MAG: 4-alpha-glucanotransferase, partial [Synergistaceae bacterium]|nr:4-alpha-glucanotransferase [Synergistaceae bacterium]